ncbi:allantoinase AllB [Cohnella sp. AR92]|uniref:allantoinase AllB n=1 Tax=Cohnella sp. AR92 TaxID=648716 RepID=UPI001EDD06E3|nr:allantoinase AllB [Cohnella sp. AR92]
MNSKEMDLAIIGGEVVLRGETVPADIGIKDGRIARIGRIRPDEATSSMDARGLHVMAGAIDVHVHLNEPGFGHWEGFETGSSALAAGGCTTYFDMPLNGVPPTVTVEALRMKREAGIGASKVDFACWGGLVPKHLDDLEALSEAGVIGFKAFMSAPGDPDEEAFREVDDRTLLEGMRRIAKLGRVLALHAESEPLVARLTAESRAAGGWTAADYTATRPVQAEVEAVERAIGYARETGCALHFVHISSGAAVAVIQAAKEEGMDVTLETCPHYLTLTDADLERIGPAAKCAPPLRGEEDREALWQAIREGRIDMISSDHSPCPTSMKEASSNLFDCWGGIAGAQSTLELMIDEGHLRRGIPLAEISRLLSYEPARRFGLEGGKGEIRVGASADLALVDLNEGYRLRQEDLLHRHPHSPYIGREFGCRVTATLLGGRVVYDRTAGVTKSAPGRSLEVRGGKMSMASGADTAAGSRVNLADTSVDSSADLAAGSLEDSSADLAAGSLEDSSADLAAGSLEDSSADLAADTLADMSAYKTADSSSALTPAQVRSSASNR